MAAAPLALLATDELDGAPVPAEPGHATSPTAMQAVSAGDSATARPSGTHSVRRHLSHTGAFCITDRRSLGEVLVQAGALLPWQLDDALSLEMATGRRMAEILTCCGYLDEHMLAFLVSRELALPWIAPHLVPFRESISLLLPRWVAEEFCVLGVHLSGRPGPDATLFVATDDPTDRAALDACAYWTQMTVRPMVALGSEIRRAISAWYGPSAHRSES